MTQEQWILLLLRIVLCADVGVTLAFIGDYSRLTRWRCYRNPVGRTIITKDILLALAFVPTILSLFMNFDRNTSYIAAWFDIVLFAAIGVVMVWRIMVFERFHRDGPPDSGGR